jgi:hypothetical protein
MTIDWEAMTVRSVNSHFLDSGAFTLWTTAAKYAKENGCGRWDYYDTPEFYAYMDAYADFIKQHQVAIDYYANVDVIPDFHNKKDATPPKLTWRNQKYLEKTHGLTPVPVIHFTLGMEWLHRYVDAGYKMIGLGGLVGQQTKARDWIERCFTAVCPPPSCMPRVRLHGFGVTSYELMIRFPWYSVDSTSWTKKAAYGYLVVPHRRAGKFVYNEQPYTITVSDDMLENPREQENIPTPYHTMRPAEKRVIQEWLDALQIPLGKRNAAGEIVEYGVTNRHIERRAANLLFYEAMRKSLPSYPWAFRATTRTNFGLIG